MEEPIGIGNDEEMRWESPGRFRTISAINRHCGEHRSSGGEPVGAKNTQGDRTGQLQL